MKIHGVYNKFQDIIAINKGFLHVTQYNISDFGNFLMLQYILLLLRRIHRRTHIGSPAVH